MALSQPKTAAETVARSKERGEDSVVRYRRVVVARPGGPEVLQLREEELPEPGL